jgi:hypothetical protein
MRPRNSASNRGLTAINGAMALIALLLIVQIWLFTATLDGYLAGHTDVVLPGFVISALCFFGCGALYLFVVRLGMRKRQ